METLVNFYKEDKYHNDIWLNREYLVQLNLTGKCTLSCEFCYMSPYQNDFLTLHNIKKLWGNLKEYSIKYGIEYRVNITGGDIFQHPKWEEIAQFIADEKSITAVDPLINTFWKKNNENLLEILKEKINFVQFNSDTVTENDICSVKRIGKKVVLKIALYNKGTTKNNINKLKRFSEKFDNIIISIDLIIPQKGCVGNKEDYLIFNISKLKDELYLLKKKFGKTLWILSTTAKRLYLKRRFAIL